MKLNKGYRLRSLGQEFILVAEGLDAVDFSRMISMNESAAFLWKEVEGKDFDAEMMTALLMDNYDIPRETAQNDVAALLESWSAVGLIEE
ncbi:MAG: PqqD family protein [Bacteroidales bacterium]|nr:PqqD family protein [Bacteroidales bacterium]